MPDELAPDPPSGSDLRQRLAVDEQVVRHRRTAQQGSQQNQRARGGRAKMHGAALMAGIERAC